MKLYHIVCGRPIGPTFEAYFEKPDLKVDPDGDMCGTWIEETDLETISQQFANHVRYAREHFPDAYFPYELKIGIRMKT